jgi:altronate dehydratase large subunit
MIAARASTPAIGAAIVDAVERREQAVAALGINLTGNNPGPENIRGGVTTIEEKALGAISKTGRSPIAGLLPMSEHPPGPGLYLMDASSFAPESMTGFVASGAQMIVFTTGAGNSICSLVAPTVKVSGNPASAGRLAEQIDFDASPLAGGTADVKDHLRQFIHAIVDHASGTLTWGEILGEGEEAFARIRASL